MVHEYRAPALADCRLTILGVGNMGEAILAGALRAGLAADHVTITDADAARLAAVAERHGALPATANPAAVRGAEVVVIAVKPRDVGHLLNEIEMDLGHQTVVVSVAAGLTTTFFDDHLHYAQPVVKVMPNTPAAIGAGVCVLSAGADAQRGHVELVKAIFAGAGTVVELPEHYQAAAGAVAGSGPAYVFYLIDAMAEAGVAAGLSRPVAQQLAIDTVLGSAQLLAQTGEHPALARERVTSPGGTTIQALRVLDQRGVRAAVVDAIAAAVARTGELTDELEEA